jgi:hypothetical protein
MIDRYIHAACFGATLATIANVALDRIHWAALVVVVGSWAVYGLGGKAVQR